MCILFEMWVCIWKSSSCSERQKASVLCLLPSLLSSCLRLLSPNSAALILVSVLLRCRPVSHCHICINMWSPRVHRLESSFFQRVTCVTSASPVVLWYGRKEKGGPRLLYQFINSWLLGKEHWICRCETGYFYLVCCFSSHLPDPSHPPLLTSVPNLFWLHHPVSLFLSFWFILVNGRRWLRSGG